MRTETKKFPDTIKRTNRAEDIVGVITEGIINGYWKPDEKISDQELSERLGVSRLTVREALAKLVERKLVEKRYWKGYTVRKLSWDEIDSLIDVRLALEELALKQTFAGMSPAVVRELEESIESARKYIDSGDFYAFFHADYLFHEIISRESGNPWLPDILQDLHVLISIVRVISQSERIADVAKESMAEHTQILAHIQAGQLDSAMESLRIHFANHRRRVQDEFSYMNSLHPADSPGT